ELMTRGTSDVRGVKDAMTESVAEILNCVIFLIGMGAVLLWLDWQLTLVFFAAVPILLFVLSVYGARAEERSRAERKREGALASVMNENLATVRMTRVLSQEERARQRFQDEYEAVLVSGLDTTMSWWRCISVLTM